MAFCQAHTRHVTRENQGQGLTGPTSKNTVSCFRFRQFITHMDSERKVSQSASSLWFLSTQQKEWRENYNADCGTPHCWGVKCRLQLSSFIFCSSNLGGQGREFHPGEDGNCLMTCHPRKIRSLIAAPSKPPISCSRRTPQHPAKTQLLCGSSLCLCNLCGYVQAWHGKVIPLQLHPLTFIYLAKTSQEPRLPHQIP